MSKRIHIAYLAGHYYLVAFTAFLVLFFGLIFSGLRLLNEDLRFTQNLFTHNLEINFQQHPAINFEEKDLEDYIKNLDGVLKIQKNAFQIVGPQNFALSYQISIDPSMDLLNLRDKINMLPGVKVTKLQRLPMVSRHLMMLSYLALVLLIIALIVKVLVIAKTTILTNQKNIETIRLMGGTRNYIAQEFQRFFFHVYSSGALIGVAMLFIFFSLRYWSVLSLKLLWQMKIEIIIAFALIPTAIICLSVIISMIIFYGHLYRIR